MSASKPGSRPSPRLIVGRVGRAHGLDGSFYVTQPVAAQLKLGAELEIDGRRRRVVRRAGTDVHPIVRLEGSVDRTDAQSLRGRSLVVPPESMPILPEGEWWASELEGCRVLDGAQCVGVVRRMLVLPSCEVLEVQRDGGGELLVPLVTDAVRRVDVQAREVDVDLGFLGAGEPPPAERT